MNEEGQKIKIRIAKPVPAKEPKVKAVPVVKSEPSPATAPAEPVTASSKNPEPISAMTALVEPFADSAKMPEVVERKVTTARTIEIKLPSFKIPKLKMPAFLSRKKSEVSSAQSETKEHVSRISVGPKGDKVKKDIREPKIFRGFSIKELVHFSKRLAFLMRSGVPVLESLQILRKQTRSRSRGRIIEVITEDVSNGRLLSAGLARFRDSFGDFAISVIRVGEMSGTLSSNLTYLAEELHKRQVLRRKVIGALVYPAFITIATIGVTVLLTVFIFPKVMPIFTSLNVTLPFTTKALLFLSNFLRGYGLYLLGAIIIFVIGLVITLRKVPAVHYFVARNILRLPLLGNLIKNYNMTNFCRILSILLRSGFNVVEAATVTSESTPNPVYKLECITLREGIVRGERISQYLESRTKLFPDIVAHMVSIGETSGSLSETLMYLADHYEAEVDDTVKNLSNSIEPVLMVFMGLVVGFVAVSVITPIYEVTQHLSR